jgi:hypothetical protein
VFGRRLFWLFVAIAGFLVGMEFAGIMLAGEPQWLQISAAAGTGLLGALLAVLVQPVAFAFAGFYAGAYLAIILTQSFGAADHVMLFFAAGGLTGAVLAVLIMDRAIMVLSCIVGAGAIVATLNIEKQTAAIVFLLLAAAGVLVQTWQMKHIQRSDRE